MREEVLRLERVTYLERDIPVLDSLSMNVFRGEVFGLVPTNGFSLDPLIRILQHNLPVHYGYIYYNDKLINSWRSSKPQVNRIFLIQNQSSLADALTVSENVFALRPGFQKHIIQQRVLNRQMQNLLNELDFPMDADIYADRLTAFEKVVVELIKAMVAGCSLVIMRDACTFISEEDLKRLPGIVHKLTERGISFLYISPHMEEAEAFCDRTALLVNGQIIKIFNQGEPSPAVAPLPLTENFAMQIRSQLKEHTHRTGKEAFSVKNLCSEYLNALSFSVNHGECLVIHDLNNRIFEELIAFLSGTRTETGTIWVDGVPASLKQNRDIAIIQEFAPKTMLFPQLSYLDNLCMTLDKRMPNVWINYRVRNSFRQEMAPMLGEDVFDCPVESLTELQKYDLVYARILLQRPSVVFCLQPFKGAATDEREHICMLLEKMLEREIAVVILAVNLADSLAVADRVLRLQQGQSPREYLREEFFRLPESTPWRNMFEQLS